MLTNAEQIISFIKETIAGTEFENHVFVAGGAVRDEVMGNMVKDVDILVDLPEGGIKLANLIGSVTRRDPIVFENFGTARIILDGFKFKGTVFPVGSDVEFVHCRKESYRGASRKPITEFGTITDDVFRRDFTINSLLKNVSTNEILDITGLGFQDISNGIIRATGNPDVIFSEDPLRTLRAIRFAIRFNFHIESNTFNGIVNNASKLKIVSSERIFDELTKILLLKNKTNIVELLIKTGIARNIDVSFDSFNDHTIKLSQQLLNKTTFPQSALAALFLKVGFLFGPNYVKNVLFNLKVPNNTINETIFLIKHCDNLLKNVHRDMEPGFFRNMLATEAFNRFGTIDFVKEFFEPLGVVITNENILKVPVNGFDLMECFGLKPGKQLGEMLKLATNIVYNHKIQDKEELMKILNILKKLKIY